MTFIKTANVLEVSYDLSGCNASYYSMLEKATLCDFYRPIGPVGPCNFNAEIPEHIPQKRNTFPTGI